MSNYAQNVHQQQNGNCGQGYRWSESEGRCVVDAFGLFGNSNTGSGNSPENFFGGTAPGAVPNEASKMPENAKRPIWQIALAIVLGVVFIWVIYQYATTGKITLPKRISLSRPSAPKLTVQGGSWGGVGID
jgi:hypothetical protein